MAVLDLQEQEQVEALKGWWKDNRNWILGTLLTALVATTGWRGWQYYQHQQAADAATLYQQVVDQVGTRDAKRVNDAAAAIMDKYASTTYAAQAALLAAQVNEQNKDLAQAGTQLKWVIDHSGMPTIRDVARLRLATILLDQQKFADALQQLDAKHADAFDGLFLDLRGDVLNAQGKTEEARSAYKLAYEKMEAGSMYRSLIQMKLDALGSAK